MGTHEDASFIVLGDVAESPAHSDFKAVPYPVLN